MGDDTTDDDMFRGALPRDSFAVKVGSVSEKALYNMPQQESAPVPALLTEKVPDASEPSRKRPGRTAIRFVKGCCKRKTINLVSP